MRPSAVSVVAVVAALSFPGVARAQPSSPPDARAATDRAVALLGDGHLDEARALLDAEVARRGLRDDAYDPAVVLLRLARAMQSRRDARPPPAPREGVEVAGLYGGLMAYGIGTGVWLDVALGLDQPVTAPWIPLGGAGAGFLTAWLLDRGHPVRRGRPVTWNTGWLLGSLAGLSVGLQGARSPTAWSAGTVATAGWVGATAGLGLAIGLGEWLDPLPGNAGFVQSGGAWGAAIGLLTGVAAQTDRNHGIYAGAGLVAGTALTWITARRLHPAAAQVRWMDVGAFSGALLGTGAALLLFDDANAWSIRVAVIALGLVGGGVAGYLFGAPDDASPSRASRALGRVAMTPTVFPLPGGAGVGFVVHDAL